jgi:hypothetical protein
MWDMGRRMENRRESGGGDPVATREGCMPVSSRQLRASSEGRPNAKAPLLSRRIPAAGISSS